MITEAKTEVSSKRNNVHNLAAKAFNEAQS
jgi:hypothetical protein